MLPGHAPFTESERLALVPVLQGLSSSQSAWLSGYLAGKAGVHGAAPALESRPLVVLYGSESGNSEKLADRTVEQAKRLGGKARAVSMADAHLADFTSETDLLVIVSTWGEGDPPQHAEPFFKELAGGGGDLSGARFSVCALGDTSYEKFCRAGKDVDAALERLGARRVLPRRDCDLEFEEPYAAWADAALAALLGKGTAAARPVIGQSDVVPAPANGYGKQNPYPAELLQRVLLSGHGSDKETWHFELSLKDSGLTYHPGDSLAVGPKNSPEVVQAVLAAAGLDGEAMIDAQDGGTKKLAAALQDDYDITGLSRAVLSKLQERNGSQALADLLADDAKDRYREWTDGRQIVDALEQYPWHGVPPGQFTGIFRKLPPRLYSIASSPLAHPGEVHLTVAAVRYQTQGRARNGVASTWLSDLVRVGGCVPVFVQQNKNFRLPEDGDAPVIMIGPGTGIAPFRAFVEHRAALGAKGRNWLFFGDRHYTHDFLYQLEWQEYLKKGVLTRLDVAFSRDQPEKVYVQHRIATRSRELYAWLQDGATVYVCGDASRMAVDVHEALISVYQEEGGLSREAAAAEVEELRKSRRYQRDVY